MAACLDTKNENKEVTRVSYQTHLKKGCLAKRGGV